jgi:hypothetical protein
MFNAGHASEQEPFKANDPPSCRFWTAGQGDLRRGWQRPYSRGNAWCRVGSNGSRGISLSAPLSACQGVLILWPLQAAGRVDRLPTTYAVALPSAVSALLPGDREVLDNADATHYAVQASHHIIPYHEKAAPRRG